MKRSVLNFASEALNVYTSIRALNTGIHDGRKNSGIRNGSCVCGYHVSIEIWEAVIGERLISEREPETYEGKTQ